MQHFILLLLTKSLTTLGLIYNKFIICCLQRLGPNSFFLLLFLFLFCFYLFGRRRRRLRFLLLSSSSGWSLEFPKTGKTATTKRRLGLWVEGFTGKPASGGHRRGRERCSRRKGITEALIAMPDEHNLNQKRIPPARTAKSRAPRQRAGNEYGDLGLGWQLELGFRVPEANRIRV